MTCECSMDSELFNFWLEHRLFPEFQKNSLVVMDNANLHRSEKKKELVEKFSCRILFLPPYSPDLNQENKILGFHEGKNQKNS